MFSVMVIVWLSNVYIYESVLYLYNCSRCFQRDLQKVGQVRRGEETKIPIPLVSVKKSSPSQLGERVVLHPKYTRLVSVLEFGSEIIKSSRLSSSISAGVS
jgi:hypothetical protein